MADQSVHDVVEQPQSVDAFRPTDVPGTNNIASAARAVPIVPAPNDSNIKRTYLPQLYDNKGSNQPSEDNHESEPSSARAITNVSRINRGHVLHSTEANNCRRKSIMERSAKWRAISI